MSSVDRDVLLFYALAPSDFNPDQPNRTVSGFFRWFLLLVVALRRRNYTVRVNDFVMAKQNPGNPIGIVGHPYILDCWSLPNPAVLGPCMYDHPTLNPALMEDHRFKYYITTCEWLHDVFVPYYGEKCVLWHAGIDFEEWADAKTYNKDIDVLIYNKIRWNKEEMDRVILDPVVNTVKKNGLTYIILRYGSYSQDEYLRLLRRCRVMIFLCEHETQGMAYQEALASNVPVLAWDPGFWNDPLYETLRSNPVPSTSVPHFSAECGERFRRIGEFANIFRVFWNHRDRYKPRLFAQRELSLEKSADRYMNYYIAAGESENT